jgi:hypothetical protein
MHNEMLPCKTEVLNGPIERLILLDNAGFIVYV